MGQKFEFKKPSGETPHKFGDYPEQVEHCIIFTNCKDSYSTGSLKPGVDIGEINMSLYGDSYPTSFSAWFTEKGLPVYISNDHWDYFFFSPTGIVFKTGRDGMQFTPVGIGDVRGYFNEKAIKYASKIPLDYFVTNDVVDGGDGLYRPGKERPLKTVERQQLDALISGAKDKFSIERIEKNRLQFLRIVGSEIPVVVPELKDHGYFALPVRVMEGCNKKKHCPMCDFNKGKFSVWPYEKIADEISGLKEYMGDDHTSVKRFFLSDTDALVLGNALAKVLDKINYEFGLNYEFGKTDPDRGFAYAFSKPETIASMRPSDLKKLRKSGLGYVNMGLETGCQELLSLVKPGTSLKDAGISISRLNDAGIKYSINIIPELGGEKYRIKHLEQTVNFLDEIKYEGKIYLAKLKRNNRYDDFLRAGRIGELPADNDQFDVFISRIVNKNYNCGIYSFVGM